MDVIALASVCLETTSDFLLNVFTEFVITVKCVKTTTSCAIDQGCARFAEI